MNGWLEQNKVPSEGLTASLRQKQGQRQAEAFLLVQLGNYILPIYLCLWQANWATY